MRDIHALCRRLIEHHTVIEAVMNHGELALRAPRLDALEIGRGRWELARALTAYQHFKHAELFDPMIARGTPAQVPRARRMKANCIRFGAQFRAHLMLWGSCDILDDWARYQPDAVAMMTRIRAHLLSERRETEQLIADGGSALRTGT